ncbi:MAG: hypothetical protein QOH56_2983, partial [Pseudonocardiales bacterium]|nr:hypothetical protein [Pseudonocardiales bacterium]
MKPSRHPRLNLPQWTTHPGFGVAALLGVAVLLIVHGEPQPSSRPSGKSVVVSGSPTAPAGVPATLVLQKGRVEYRLGSTVRRVALPSGARPRSILTSRGLSVVMAAVGNRQRAYAVTKDLKVTDLGPADAALPAAQGTEAIVLEVALVDPGVLDQVAPLPSASSSPSGSVTTSSKPPPGQAVAKDFGIRRYDSSGRMVQALRDLPRGMRAAVDTVVGLVVWKPVNPVFDGSTPLESLSAAAQLVRPNGTLRALGSVHPLAATTSDLLVWDVQRRQFGIMPLRYVTSTATSTASPSPDPTQGSSGSRSASSESPSATPTIVVGTRWYDPTRGFIVTGPASFAPDGSAFAVYAQVGSRRRLVVAQLDQVLTNQIEVLALTAPTSTPSPTPTPS